MFRLQNLYVNHVLSKRKFWENYNKAHPVLFEFLSLLNYSYKTTKSYRYWRIYSQYREFTMIPRYSYVNNLMLADKFRHLAGVVVECGVWKGGMIGGLAKLLGDQREYYLFDSFEGLPLAQDIDGEPARAWQTQKQMPLAQENLKADISFAHQAMRLSGVSHFHIVPGWFNQTLPCYNPEKKIAILRIDGDWYESTLDVLNNLYRYVVKGGLIIIDDYYFWDGCSRAVHEFFSKNALTDRVRQFQNDFCYIIKNRTMFS